MGQRHFPSSTLKILCYLQKIYPVPRGSLDPSYAEVIRCGGRPDLVQLTL